MVVDPGSRGFTEHRHIAEIEATDSISFENDDTADDQQPLLHMPGTSQALCMHVPQSYAFVSSRHGSHLGGNAYWDGTNWLRFDESAAAGIVVAGHGTMHLYTAPAGSGAIVMTPKFSVDSAGNTGVKGTLIAEGAASMLTTLNVGGALAVGGTVGASGSLTAHAGATVNGGLVSNGKLTVSAGQPYSISNPAGGLAPVEIVSGGPSAGGGAAMMAFHRPGAYAAYFGIDSDNQWRVGGWSMGAVANRLLTDNEAAEGHSGSTLVRRTAAGYIYCNYINTTADLASGPLYLAGQNGDGFLRWYPKSLFIAGSGASPIFVSTSGTFTGTGSISITIDRAGYWVLIVTPVSTGTVDETAAGTPQMDWTLSWPGGSKSDHIEPIVESSSGGGHSRVPFGVAHGGYMAAGTATFSITGYFSCVFNLPLYLHGIFAPTPSYPT